MLYFICTTGTMVPRVPDTFSCPSKSSRIFIKVFFFCLFPHTTVGVVLRYPYLTFLLHVLLIF